MRDVELHRRGRPPTASLQGNTKVLQVLPHSAAQRVLSVRGFTLVELLVVIAIIGALVALLVPAVQSARESARRTQCTSHLRQLSLAMLSHESAQGFFPTGGWAIYWTGDADRGFGPRQPGGWVFNLLPFMEEQDLRDAGRGLQGVARVEAVVRRDATPIHIMNCPSRRPSQPYPNSGGISFHNGGLGNFHARGDYAMNVGDVVDYEHVCFHFGPSDYSDADQRNWSRWVRFSGVSYCGSRIRMKDIKDGTSHTYAIGERYINPVHYDDGDGLANNAPMYVGIQTDIYRSTYFEDLPGLTMEMVRLPHRDEPGLDLDEHFGSAHFTGFQMAMCDGSTRLIPYDIDGVVFSRHGNRADGAVSSP